MQDGRTEGWSEEGSGVDIQDAKPEQRTMRLAKGRGRGEARGGDVWREMEVKANANARESEERK
jgi:hypothetical protein